MALATRALGLKILVDGKSYDRVIQVGESVVVGRDAAAQVVVPHDSISSKHLEVLWDGEKVLVRDLESSNGTFRMPQDAPFAEALFEPTSLSSLKLRIAKIPLELSWFLPDTDMSLSEKTQVLEAKLSLGSGDPKLTKTSDHEIPLANTSKPTPARAHNFKAPREASFEIGIFVAGVFFGLTSLIYYGVKYFDLLASSWALLRLGQSVDLYLFWLDEMNTFGVIFVLAMLLGFLFVNKKISFASHRPKTLILLGLLAGFLPFSIPMAALALTPKPFETFEAASRYRSIQAALSSHDFKNKASNIAIASELNTLSKSLIGSSIIYTFWHNFQKKRVISECGGVGSGAWQKKRFCLTLLFALSLESYSKIRPVYMRKTASNLVLLSSLDGVVRVLAAEGPDSEHLKIFLNSLNDVGLVDELQAFLSLVQSFKGQRFEDLMKALLDVRFQLEAKLMDMQKKSDLPRQLSLNLTGPLEMGI
jgi:hypothetical protein